MPYMVTFTINIPQVLAYIPYMDPMGYKLQAKGGFLCDILVDAQHRLTFDVVLLRWSARHSKMVRKVWRARLDR
jgi:hypothetical protein